MKIEGIVTGVFRDVNTGKVTKTFEKERNHISEWMMDNFADNSQTPMGRNIYITDFPYLTTTRQTETHGSPGQIAIGATEAGVDNPIDGGGSVNPDVPWWIQFQQRFSPPAVERTITCVGLTSDATITNDELTPSHACVQLTVPCIQAITETLDVFYRVQFSWDYFEDAPEDGNGWDRNEVYLLFRQHSASVWTTQWPTKGSAVGWNPNVNARQIDHSYHGGDAEHDLTPAGSSFTWARDTAYSKLQFTNIADIADGIGQVIGNFCYGDGDAWCRFNTRAVHDTDTPIQNLFGHSASADKPFFDSGNLPTGAATMALGGTWTNPSFPKLYAIDITGSGVVGAATYRLRERNHFGFENNTYYDKPRGLVFSNANNDHLTEYFEMDKDPDTTFDTEGPRWIRYGDIDGWQIAVKQDSICVLDYMNERGFRFKVDDYPLFTPTDITDVTTDSNGDIYVACRASGLYKITSPTSSAVITKIDDTTTGLTGAAGPQMYGVAAGRNDKIWIMMDGGLFYSDNGGTSWTQATFSFTGISDANWSEVKQISADIEHANDQIGIVYRNSRFYACWYELSTTTASAGPDILGSFFTADNWVEAFWWNPNIEYTYLNLLAVSRTQSNWGNSCRRTSASNTFGAPAYFTFGTNAILQYSVDNNYTFSVNEFATDDDGNESLFYKTGPFNPHYIAFYKANDTFVQEELADFNDWITSNTGFKYGSRTPMGYMGRGIMHMYNQPWYMYIATYGSRHNADGGIIKNELWNEYGWDGGAWVLDHVGSKTTHGTEEAIIDGLTIQFDDDGGTETYFATDYYTVGVLKGVWLDGSTEYRHDSYMYMKPVFNDTDLEISVIPNTVRVPDAQLFESSTTWQDVTSFMTTATTQARLSSTYSTQNYSRGARSVVNKGGPVTTLPGGEIGSHCYVRMQLFNSTTAWEGANAGQMIWGMSDVSVVGDAITYGGVQFGFHVDGQVDTGSDLVEIKVVESGVTKFTYPTWQNASAIKDGSANMWFHIVIYADGSVQYWMGYAPVYTSPPGTADPSLYYLQDLAMHGNLNAGIVDVGMGGPVGADRYFEMGVAGSPATGRYRNEFQIIDTARSEIYIDGTPAVKYVNDTAVVLGAGEVSIQRSSGIFRVSPSDVGKTITANYYTQVKED